VDYLRYTEHLNAIDKNPLSATPPRSESLTTRAGSNQSLSWRARHGEINVRLIRGETPTAGDLSTLQSVTAQGDGEDPPRHGVPMKRDFKRTMSFWPISIFSRRFVTLRIAALLVPTVGLVACDPLWPSAKVNTDELGRNGIGQFLRSKFLWGASENDIARGVRELLVNSVGKDVNSRSDVESTGMRCDHPPSTGCSYRGKVVYQFEGLPKNAAHRNKRIVVTIHINLISYTNLNNLVVHKERIEERGE
jgi:hypothetical protein